VCRPDPLLRLARMSCHTLNCVRTEVAAHSARKIEKSVQFTVGHETHATLRRAQDLMRHAVPNGDPSEIFSRALTLLVEHLERTKMASVKRPRVPHAASVHSRHIPSAVKRAVWARDGGCCAFVGKQGRCAEPGFLEFHHVVPYASGGAATADNIQLRSRAHNQYEAAQEFLGRINCLRWSSPIVLRHPRARAK
jgi:5-methylcytosine-specific restriction endonuclease McrA